MPLNTKQIEILTTYDKYFWETGNPPTLERLAELTESDTKVLNKLLQSELFQVACHERGLPGPLEFRLSKGLTPQQVLAVEVVLNLHDKRSLTTKLKEIGITTKTYQAWLNEEAFVGYIKNQLDKRFNNVDIDAKLSLAQLVTNGDLPAIKYFHEFTGIYRPNQENVFNFTLVLSRVMEVFAKYVSSEVLRLVADEIEGVLVNPERPALNSAVLAEVISESEDSEGKAKETAGLEASNIEDFKFELKTEG